MLHQILTSSFIAAIMERIGEEIVLCNSIRAPLHIDPTIIVAIINVGFIDKIFPSRRVKVKDANRPIACHKQQREHRVKCRIQAERQRPMGQKIETMIGSETSETGSIPHLHFQPVGKNKTQSVTRKSISSIFHTRIIHKARKKKKNCVVWSLCFFSLSLEQSFPYFFWGKKNYDRNVTIIIQ